MRRKSIHRFSTLLGLALCMASPSGLGAAEAEGCVPVGAWVDPASGERRADMPAVLAGRSVVLLGESHDAAEHHRWQLHTIAALHGHRRDIVLGFEMFPRRVQPVLDRWVAGELNEADFLREVDWRKVWGMDSDLYMPLFHFARMHRVPMLALNVDRAVSRRIASDGLAALSAAEREGVDDPAPAADAYRARLFEIFLTHAKEGERPSAESGEFRRFVEAQLFWDRAMAEPIGEVAARAQPGRAAPLVIGIMGQGHVQYGEGVPHQLAALGIHDVATALPWDTEDCDGLDPDVADAVFGLAPPDRDDDSEGSRQDR